MSSQRYTLEFQDDAVLQVLDCSYFVTDVAERLGVSAHSLYMWVKTVKPDNTEQRSNELV